MSSFAASLLAAGLLAVAAAQTCSTPPPAAGFDVSTFFGTWYEIARIQTAGR
jgi:lipocalin